MSAAASRAEAPRDDGSLIEALEARAARRRRAE